MLLVLGAAGFVGTAVARAAAEADHEVHLLVRRPAPELEQYGKVHVGDARRTGLGLDPETADHLAAEVRRIVFTMGGVAMDMSMRQARSEHLAPLTSALAFARRCTNLEGAAYVSSIAALGDTGSRLGADQVPADPRFRNFYEWAKFRGEQLVRRARLTVPVRIVRPGHIMNSTDGHLRTRSSMVLFDSIPFLASGAPLVIGPDVRYWCGPVDLVAAVTLDATRPDFPLDAVWAVDPRSPGLEEMLDLLSVRHGIGGARYVTRRGAKLLSSMVDPARIGARISRETLGYLHATFDLDLSCLGGLVADGRVTLPESRAYITDTIDHEVARHKELA